MLSSLLASAAENIEYDSVTGNVVPYLGKGEVFLFALLGFAITFIGIILLIFVVWLCGYIVKRASAKKKEPAAAEAVSSVRDDEIGEDVKAAIVAAIAAYYAGEESSCEFKVKRIRRL